MLVSKYLGFFSLINASLYVLFNVRKQSAEHAKAKFGANIIKNLITRIIFSSFFHVERKSKCFFNTPKNSILKEKVCFVNIFNHKKFHVVIHAVSSCERCCFTLRFSGNHNMKQPQSGYHEPPLHIGGMRNFRFSLISCCKTATYRTIFVF